MPGHETAVGRDDPAPSHTEAPEQRYCKLFNSRFHACRTKSALLFRSKPIL